MIKLVMLGGGGVGKRYFQPIAAYIYILNIPNSQLVLNNSAITIQFVQSKFVNEYDPTIGIYIYYFLTFRILF